MDYLARRGMYGPKRQTVKVNLRSYARAGGEVIAQRVPYHYPKVLACPYKPLGRKMRQGRYAKAA